VKPATLLLAAAACALAWWQLAPLHEAARLWTIVLLVPLPALLIAQGRGLAELDSIPRTQAYVSSILSLWALALATFGILRISGGAVSPDPTRAYALDAPGVGLAAAVTAAGIAVLFIFRAAGMREARLMHQLLPASAQERVLFVALSISAGICEEFIYRGFLLHALTQATTLPIALVLASGAFGVAHAYQQPAGALRATLLGALLAVPVLVTGSLLPSMFAHALIDVLAGLWLARYLLR
jgi:membrane protease YdiL (CAAX protease family)